MLPLYKRVSAVLPDISVKGIGNAGPEPTRFEAAAVSVTLPLQRVLSGPASTTGPAAAILILMTSAQPFAS